MLMAGRILIAEGTRNFRGWLIYIEELDVGLLMRFAAADSSCCISLYK